MPYILPEHQQIYTTIGCKVVPNIPGLGRGAGEKSLESSLLEGTLKWALRRIKSFMIGPGIRPTTYYQGGIFNSLRTRFNFIT